LIGCHLMVLSPDGKTAVTARGWRPSRPEDGICFDFVDVATGKVLRTVQADSLNGLPGGTPIEQHTPSGFQ
jgi:hypothetical protein